MVQHRSRVPGATAISATPLREVRQVDPAICDQIEELRSNGSAPIKCDAYSNLTLSDVASSEHLPLTALVEDVQHGQPPADNTPPKRSQHRVASTGHRESPEQRLAVHTGVFDVPAELAQLQREPAWTDGDQNAKTLVKKPDLRIVLMILKAGASVQQHFAPGSITIHTLFGRLRVAFGDHAVELDAGNLLSLDAGKRHDMEAVEASAFLLTLAR